MRRPETVLKYYQGVILGGKDKRFNWLPILPCVFLLILLCMSPMKTLGWRDPVAWEGDIIFLVFLALICGLPWWYLSRRYYKLSEAVVMKSYMLLSSHSKREAYRNLFETNRLLHPAIVREDSFKFVCGLVLLDMNLLEDARIFFEALSKDGQYNESITIDDGQISVNRMLANEILISKSAKMGDVDHTISNASGHARLVRWILLVLLICSMLISLWRLIKAF